MNTPAIRTVYQSCFYSNQRANSRGKTPVRPGRPIAGDILCRDIRRPPTKGKSPKTRVAFAEGKTAYPGPWCPTSRQKPNQGAGPMAVHGTERDPTVDVMAIRNGIPRPGTFLWTKSGVAQRDSQAKPATPKGSHEGPKSRPLERPYVKPNCESAPVSSLAPTRAPLPPLNVSRRNSDANPLPVCEERDFRGHRNPFSAAGPPF